MKHGVRFAAAILLAALAAGPAEAAAGGSKVSAARVSVKLVEFKLIPSVRRIAAGKVTFVVRNAGKIPHEFVVLRTATPASKLPVKGVKAQEPGRIAKIAEFKAGVTKTLTLTLARGHYVLLCNLPGHYRAGQFADFTVG